MKLTAKLFRILIRGYQLLITPILPGSCRYHPTCSQYALDSVDRFGAVRGSWLTLKRLLRCHPWGAHGYDPVPDRLISDRLISDGPISDGPTRAHTRHLTQ